MTPNTTTATPTPDDLARALALIDADLAAYDAFAADGNWTSPTIRAALAVARATIARRAAGLERAAAYAALFASEYQPGWQASVNAADSALYAAERAEDAAVAAACVLAVDVTP